MVVVIVVILLNGHNCAKYLLSVRTAQCTDNTTTQQYVETSQLTLMQ